VAVGESYAAIRIVESVLVLRTGSLEIPVGDELAEYALGRNVDGLLGAREQVREVGVCGRVTVVDRRELPQTRCEQKVKASVNKGGGRAVNAERLEPRRERRCSPDQRQPQWQALRQTRCEQGATNTAQIRCETRGCTSDASDRGRRLEMQIAGVFRRSLRFASPISLSSLLTFVVQTPVQRSNASAASRPENNVNIPLHVHELSHRSALVQRREVVNELSLHSDGWNGVPCSSLEPVLEP